ncbi:MULTISPECIES: alanine racemase [unclassified Acinetobacter]|uniref:alanine racemase n=1 Tax=unclassified Acinetobacter TaxID=196816 RepID=UPI00244C4FCD|nr:MULTISPECIES: alanine racemase [unclassified Acinetobacter]MDH0031798.1 alanine racemase [Acinetobacter sp. GD04021]MDH0886113.1 alanine racemase [Acinetobacter sp. GD03873]MDH1082733.1 alanine racemase [Acinetobacter sp. GD03983]MDH2189472.1 alanine racemase [Acinetobacter sp. GD03645]MDH2204822.1 alanine racemase [Acinetobacter sp. GD03647]
MRQATVYIDSEALQYNLNRVKQLAPHSKIVSMVKANAYGHGVKDCLAALSATDAFGVACLEEALEIRQLGYAQPITLIEGIFSDDEMTQVIEQKLECVVHQPQQVEWLIAHKDHYNALNLKVWVKLNSGMNRLGFKATEIIEVIQQLKSHGFTCVLTMHFANADSDHPLNEQQKNQFLQVKQACEPILASCCNSAAIYKYPELHFDFVRPGIMLYGATPFADQNVHTLDLKPVMSFEAEIIALNQIQANEYVGYGSTFTATQPMNIAIVSIGYGDGYPRAYIKPNFVTINQQLIPMIGRVSMDMIAIDVTHIQAEIGTKVELWGKSRLVDDVAAANGTIGYELLCRLSQRPKRQVT